MSTTKPLLVKAEKPQDQTFASSLQAVIDHTLADQTTELSKAIEEANTNALLYGNARIQVNTATDGTITAGPFITHLGSNGTSANIRSITPSVYPPRVRLKRTELETHPAFELTVEQLRAAWMLAYGTRWVSMEEPMNDDYLNVVAHRLISFGDLETHDVIDQYTPMGRIKI